MTGGTVVSLGSVGDNFGAGFTGGQAFIFDADGTFEHRINPDTLAVAAGRAPLLAELLRGLSSGTWRKRIAAMPRICWWIGPHLAAVLAGGAEEYVKYLPVPITENAAAAGIKTE